MKMKGKRSLATRLLALFLILAMAMPTYGASFTDVTEKRWYTESVERWGATDVLNGYPDGSFRPDQSVTRAEVAKALCAWLGLTEAAENTFTDVSEKEWYAEYVLCCAKAEIIKGYPDKTFRPNETVTREQAITMIMRAAGMEDLNPADDIFAQFKDGDKVSAWAADAVANAIAIKAVCGYTDNTLRLQETLSRAELAKVLDYLNTVYIDGKGNISLTTQNLEGFEGTLYVVNSNPQVEAEISVENGKLTVEVIGSDEKAVVATTAEATGKSVMVIYRSNDESYLNLERVAEGETVRVNEAPVELPEAIRWDNPNAPIDKTKGIQMVFHGYYEEPITVGEETRTAKVYIPDGAEIGAYFVALTVPDGLDTEEFLVDSGWIKKANEEKFCLFVMEPKAGDGKWGAVEEEAAYVSAAYAALVAGKYYLPFPTFYLVGYGTGGTALQKYAMTNAITVAGAVFINASDIDAAYLEEMGEKICAQSTVAYDEVPVPVWIIEEKLEGNAAKVVDYWKSANESVVTGEAFALNSTAYVQNPESENPFTVRGNVVKTVVLEGKVDITDESLVDTLYDEFLSQYTRYGGNAGGNVVGTRPDYEALGVDFGTMEIDGYLREYLVYVPEDLRDSKEKVPVVYSLHGGNQTYKMMFDISRWWEVADEEGFILVMPTSTVDASTDSRTGTPSWNSYGAARADDNQFLAELIKVIDEKYPVDTTRRYLSGQSNGSMMVNCAGMTIPQYFAALGSSSGPITKASNIPENAATSKLPVYLLFGEFDFWSWNTMEGSVNLTLDYWITRNEAGKVEAPDSVETEGRYTTYEWLNEDYIPMYRYTQTAGRGHSFVPEEMEMIWDWFTCWKQDENGNSVYMDGEIQVPEAIRWESPNAPIDKAEGIQMAFHGYYEEPITVGEETRTAKVYIPDGAEMGAYFVVLTVPDGMDTEEFLVDSGWIKKANEEKFCLFVMEPKAGDGKWGTTEEEAGYVKAAYAALVAGKYYLPFPTFYLVGYGTGGTVLQKYAMTNAITVAGAVFINASDIDTAYLAEMGEQLCAKSTVAYDEVPVPVWIIEEKLEGNAAKVVDYWKSANESVEAGDAFALNSTAYAQNPESENEFTARGNVVKTVVLEGQVDIMDESLADTLYDEFLSQYTRYGGNAGGNVVGTRPDYEALGVDFGTMEIDGYLREYMVYVPEALRASKEKAPVVYSMHGSNQTYKMMFDISRWWEVADEEGFILVMPTSTVNNSSDSRTGTPSWNSSGTAGRSDDVKFLEALVAEIDAKYNVDTSKRYLSGQSNGSMMTNYAGMKIPQYFAALGSSSGPIMASMIPEDAATSKIPAYLLFGQYDFWNWDIMEGNVNLTLDYWITRNEAGNVAEPDSVETVGRYTTYEWLNEDYIPMYRYTQTAGRGHSFVPEEMEMIWDWFNCWHQDAEGKSVYTAPVVGEISVE